MVEDDASYIRRIEAERMEKDEFFRTHPHSPIPWSVRPRMKGLAYFPPDPAYRVHAKLVRSAKPEPIVLATSKGVPRDMVKYGHLEFAVGGQTRRLQVYKPPDLSGSLFVPFRDATSAKESYGAARYLDIDEHRGDDFVVDFNLAYNPYCAYSEDYVCPFPPRENWLDVPIRAGEKDFRYPPGSDEHGHAHR